MRQQQASTKGTRTIRIATQPCHEPPPPGLAQGVQQFNEGQFFECHETLEALWMAESKPIRQLYQGILQIGVAFHHLKAERYRATLFLLERGCAYLSPFAPVCQGIDIAGLLAGTAQCLDLVQALGPEGVNEFDWSLVPSITIRD